jgi:uncharacterized membrane protein
MIVLAVIGLIVSIYLVLVHYTSVPLVCSDTGLINCGSVLNSSYAYLLGIPIAVYGVVFFVVELVVLWLTSAKFKGRDGNDMRMIYNALGLAFVVYLLYAEYMVGHICIYCTTVHVVVVLLFILSLVMVLRKPSYYAAPNPY